MITSRDKNANKYCDNWLFWISAGEIKSDGYVLHEMSSVTRRQIGRNRCDHTVMLVSKNIIFGSDAPVQFEQFHSCKVRRQVHSNKPTNAVTMTRNHPVFTSDRLRRLISPAYQTISFVKDRKTRRLYSRATVI